jgi:hypothetical protein
MTDLEMAENDDYFESLRESAMDAWEDEQYEQYAARDEENYMEWLDDNDLTDSPVNRDAYEDYLVDEQERRAGV